ncbi:small rab-related gtpase [Anaeramoeba ignava]|uniref:Small rab-related gtpase n=1 Tax=Anaeramoeba ignava TaxID=1746090 RepID=A0A9Q0LNP9_ANAIG|nr:small rab-related gtpase [Anaeramoeba ignava]
MSFDYLFKVIIFGDSAVGKTSLINRYVDNTFFTEVPPTFGVEFKTKDLQNERETTRLQLWDTTGQNDCRIPFTSSIYKNAHGILIVFSLIDEKSIQEIEYFIREIDDYCTDKIEIILVGNKSDLPNQISNVEELVKEHELSHDFKIFKTSALDGSNVSTMFEYLTEQMKLKNPKTQRNIQKRTDDDDIIKIGGDKVPEIHKEKRKCC